MAKEDREAEHMLGQDDPQKNQTKNKTNFKKKAYECTEMMEKASANKQPKQRRGSALCLCEQDCFGLLAMSTQSVTGEKLHNKLLISTAV